MVELLPSQEVIVGAAKPVIPRVGRLPPGDLEGVEVLFVYGLGVIDRGDYELVYLAPSPGELRSFLTPDLLADPHIHLYFLEDLLLPYLAEKFAGRKSQVVVLVGYRESPLVDRLRGEIACNARQRAELELCGAPYFANFWPNAHLLRGSYQASSLFDQFQGVPAVICGAGPSLDGQIDALRAIGERALIIAGGSAVQILSEAGVIPHLTAFVDPNHSQYERVMMSQTFEIPALYRARVNHQALAALHGPRLYVAGDSYGTASWLERRLGIASYPVETGPNVICLLAHIAHRMGCNPIYLAGMDLCYQEGKSHAGGLVEPQEEVIEVEGALTNWKWRAEAQWLGDYAAVHPEVTWGNLTSGGLPIPGFSKADLVADGPKLDLKGKVHSLLMGAPIQVEADEVVTARDEMAASLQRAQAHLEVLAKGESALAEVELEEEIAYGALLEGSIGPREDRREHFSALLKSAKINSEVIHAR